MLGRAGERIVVIFGDPLRVVRVRGGRVNHFRVVGVARGPALAVSESSDPRTTGRRLAEFLRQNRIKTRRAVAVLPARALTFRTLLLPPMPERELRQAAWGEVEGYVHLPPEEVLFGLVPLGEVPGEEGTRRVQVLAAVASRRTLESYREAVLAAGLRLDTIEFAPVAALRSLFLRGALTADDPVCAVIVGDGEGIIAVASEGRLRLLRTGEYALGRERIAEAILADLRASLRYYETRIRAGSTVGRIVAILDRETSPPIASALSREFGGMVEFAEVPQGVVAEEELASPYLHAVAQGAALARADRVLVLPLRPVERLRPRRRVPLEQAFALLTLLVALGIGSGILRVNRELATSNGRLQEVRREAQELQAQLAARQEEAAKQAKSAATVLRQVQALPRPPWSEVLSALEQLPQGVWLTSLEAIGSENMALEGVSLSPGGVAAFLEQLARMPAFEQVVLRRAQEEELAGRGVVRFRIEATVRPSWALTSKREVGRR
jgi:Tfp pilus assembly protein PilN